MIALDKTIITKEMIDAAAEALANEPPLFGESITKFEEEFAAFCGTDHAVSVASGTDALTFSLMAVGLEGRRALTTPLSYIATANAAFHAGGEPAFADIEGDSGNIDPALAKKAMVKRIRAIIPVHLHGYPADMDRIMDLSGKGIAVIEDAAQAHGAIYRGRRVGSIGDAGCFSFNPVKNMSVGGEAGMIVTNDEKIAKKARMLADAGRESPYTHEHALVGFSSRLNTVNAAIGRVQLSYLERWNDDRRWLAAAYRRNLAGAAVGLPPEGDGILPVYNKFAIRLGSKGGRDSLRDHLYRNGIESDSHYPIPIHMQPPYRKLGYGKGDFPRAELFADTTLSLPMYVGMSETDLSFVCEKVTEFLGK